MSKEKFEIKLIRTVDDVFDPWELSNFINIFGNEYYKIDLLLNIVKELQNGIKPENIIILNNSIKRKHINQEVINLNNTSHFNIFQGMGYPISLYPNEEIFKLKIIIKLYKKFNVILNSNIPGNVLSEVYIRSLNATLNFTLDELKEFAHTKISKKGDSSAVKNNINSITEAAKVEYKEFLSIKEDIKEYAELLYNNDLKNSSKVNVSIEHFQLFFELFKRNQKPFVGVYNEEENSIRIVCSNHLKKRKDSLPELDFKKFGHNSPPFFDIFSSSLQAGKAIYDSKKEQELREEQMKTERERQKTENKKQETENEKQETERQKREAISLRKQIFEEQLRQLREKRSKENCDIKSIDQEISELKNEYIKAKVQETYTHQTNEMTLLLKRNKLNLKDSSKFDTKV